ncbi:TBC1 domain family member 20 [Aplysia californica]|uniref:TBC1 domain family member 20 n=1 Tax=Aplysia californica TaxID=6500 RepID=A0ABM0JH55_APLCA|nr:TBC1 domain family member 20 [Aplysia californica]XP_005093565.1 TBC1 domain family member 20 [Aplysia californica]
MDSVSDDESSEVIEESSTVEPTPTSTDSNLRPTSPRHRLLDPEPPRSSQEDEDGFFRVPDDDVVPSSYVEKNKVVAIEKALASDPVDIMALKNLAISRGGLVNKSLRQRVWPLLICANTNNVTPKPSQEEMEACSKTYNQVVMDVNRSSSRFPPGIDDTVRMAVKDKLVDLIMRVMLKNKQLKYYQGFHDVCITFLLCMDEDLAFAMVEKLAMSYMREYLDDTMERTSLLLNTIYPLVNKCNPELCEHMQRNDLGTIFALSWVITWFSHVLGDIKRIMRVFDFFLASHRMMPVYLSAAFVLYREQDIFDAGDEMGYIHKCLSTMPSDLPIEYLLERAGDLYLQYPPTEISRDPMLIRLNREVFEHFNRIDSQNARRLARANSDARGRLFVRMTMWTVTAVIGVAIAVLYHAYSENDWHHLGALSPFSS